MLRLVRKLKFIFNIFIEFGLFFSIFEFLSSVFGMKTKIGKYFFYKKHELVKTFIRLEFSTEISKFKYMKFDKLNKISPTSNIWFFWWQGSTNMPEVVKSCYNNLCYFKNQHEINFVSEDNLFSLIEIPDVIKRKVKEGKISFTHFSDYVRVKLLSKYGGLWIDSTVLITSVVPQEIYNYSFYTIKHMQQSDFHVCKGLWFVSILFSSEKNLFLEFVSQVMERYLIKYDTVITYLLLDSIIAVGYEEIDYVKNLIDTVNENNENYIDLDRKLKNKFYIMKNIESQWIFKLSYKENYPNFDFLLDLIDRR